MRLTILGLCAVCLLISEPARAAEPPIVVLMQVEGNPSDEEGRPGLEVALRIQLRGRAEVRSVRVGAQPTIPERVRAAESLVAQAGADWVVWADVAETPRSEPLALLYVVGRREGRALVEVVRVPGGRGPDVDRSLALKVSEVVGGSEDGGGAAHALGQPASATSTGTPAPAAAESSVSGLLELGGEIAANDGPRGAAFVDVGPRFQIGALRLAVPLELAVVLRRSDSSRNGEVRWSELSPALWVRVQAPAGLTWLGAAVALQVSVVDAEGTAPSGERGTASQLVPAWLLAFDAELPLCTATSARAGSCAFGVRLALGLQQRLRRQRFAVEGTEIADLGRSTPFARASLLWQP